MNYNWYRHYDPTVGRYVQPDPMGFVDGPSLYAYAKSAPTTEVDPKGLQIVIPIPRPGFTPVPPTLPGFDEWRKNAENNIKGILKLCRRMIGNGGGNNDNYCHERWDREYAACKKFHPFGYRYQLACQDRANDRFTLCQKKGDKPDPNEPPEYGWNDIPRDPATR